MIRTTGLLALVILSFASPLAAEHHEGREIAVVATDPEEVEGAAEISDFRSVVEDSRFVPAAISLSLEGLLADYSLALAAPDGCEATLCIGAEAMASDLLTRPDDDVFVGLSFSQNMHELTLPTEPMSLVLVVDRSGSMKGWKLGDVQEGLISALREMRDSDRIGIVSFGGAARVDLEVTEIGSSRVALDDVVEGLKADGETDMEAGLRLGFDQARQSGATRVVLLSDDLPNIYGGRSDGFVSMAKEAAAEGIELTVVGVGHLYDNTTALQLSSLNGGRFHEVTPHYNNAGLLVQALPHLFGGGPDGAVVTLVPGDGRRISAVYGVPESLISRQANGSLQLDLGAAYVSQRGSGVYIGLTPSEGAEAANDSALMEVRLSYTEGDELVEVTASANMGLTTSNGLAGAHQLVDEYLVLEESLSAWHEQGDPMRAAELASFLNARISRSGLAFLERERAIVASLAERMAMTLGNAPPPELLGRWNVHSERGLSGTTQGDLVEFTDTGEFIIYRRSGEEQGIATRQTYQQGDGKILIDNTDLVFDYEIKGGGKKLTLKAVRGSERLNLRKAN